MCELHSTKARYRRSQRFDWPLVMASTLCLVLGCNAPLPEVIVTEDKVQSIEKLLEQFYGTILISVNGEITYQHDAVIPWPPIRDVGSIPCLGRI